MQVSGEVKPSKGKLEFKCWCKCCSVRQGAVVLYGLGWYVEQRREGRGILKKSYAIDVYGFVTDLLLHKQQPNLLFDCVI